MKNKPIILHHVMMRFIKKLILCRILMQHDWTCAASENIPPTEAQLRGGLDGFWDYAIMYCKRCGRKYYG